MQEPVALTNELELNPQFWRKLCGMLARICRIRGIRPMCKVFVWYTLFFAQPHKKSHRVPGLDFLHAIHEVPFSLTNILEISHSTSYE